MALSVTDIQALFEQRGNALYGGEAISQLEHALQTAWAAEQAGSDDALVAACLLHDLGHLLFEQGDSDLAEGRDDLHQHKVLPFLRPLLPDAVVEPIALHVDAKRYLCAVEPGYRADLSEASLLSLALQGGVMSTEQAEAFIARPHAAAAVQLRRHDDAAKVVGLATPALAHFLPRVQRLARA
jgi:phosphonate degradation associated HDIG domain protein